MIAVGFILLAAAVAGAVIVIVQNRGTVVDVHALGHTWTGHMYWVLVAGLVIAAVGLIGLAMMRGGAVRARRLRREEAALAAENERLSQRAVGDTTDSPFFADPELTPPTTAVPGRRRSFFRRSHHAV